MHALPSTPKALLAHSVSTLPDWGTFPYLKKQNRANLDFSVKRVLMAALMENLCRSAGTKMLLLHGKEHGYHIAVDLTPVFQQPTLWPVTLNGSGFLRHGGSILWVSLGRRKSDQPSPTPWFKRPCCDYFLLWHRIWHSL